MQVQNSAKRARNALGGSSMPAPRNLMAPPRGLNIGGGAKKSGEREGQEEGLGTGTVCAETGEQSQQSPGAL
eukprot:1137638-Pelagomonas_calceolata.AAC.5